MCLFRRFPRVPCSLFALTMSTQSLIPQPKQNPAPPESEHEQKVIAELRQLLLGTERAQAARLRPHLERINPHELGRVLPTAIRLRSDETEPGDQQLADALMPTIASALRVAVKRDPQSVADAIFPVMGPAIRQAVWHQFSQFVQQLDKRLQHGLSWQGLKWRIEAWQTKKSFAEIVLYHTLLYRVEHVYLIHRETGLLLEHAARGEVSESDAEIESGMLTAFKTGIQDLAHDIYKNEADASKSVMRVGELEFWFAQGPQVVLACVLRGAPPEEFYTGVMAPTIETIQRDYAAEIDEFQGDPAPFGPTRPLLEACLQESQRNAESQGFRVSPYLLVPVTVIIIALAVWAFLTIRDNRRWREYLGHLEDEPGIVITETGVRGGRYYVAGLLDPLAKSPEAILARTSALAPDDVTGRWQPYQALDAEIVDRRVREILKPPDSVKLALSDGVLTASGSAPQSWIEQARRIAGIAPGVNSFREQGLIDEEILNIKAKMEAEVPRFIVGTARFAPGQDEKRRQLLDDVKRLFDLADRNRVAVRMEVTGHTDDTGTVEFNDRLSRERAEMVRALFIASGIDASRLTAIGVGSRQPVRADPQTNETEGAEMNRSVTFHISVDAGSQ